MPKGNGSPPWRNDPIRPAALTDPEFQATVRTNHGLQLMVLTDQGFEQTSSPHQFSDRNPLVRPMSDGNVPRSEDHAPASQRRETPGVGAEVRAQLLVGAHQSTDLGQERIVARNRVRRRVVGGDDHAGILRRTVRRIRDRMFESRSQIHLDSLRLDRRGDARQELGRRTTRQKPCADAEGTPIGHHVDRGTRPDRGDGQYRERSLRKKGTGVAALFDHLFPETLEPGEDREGPLDGIRAPIRESGVASTSTDLDRDGQMPLVTPYRSKRRRFAHDGSVRNRAIAPLPHESPGSHGPDLLVTREEKTEGLLERFVVGPVAEKIDRDRIESLHVARTPADRSRAVLALDDPKRERISSPLGLVRGNHVDVTAEE